MIAGIFSDDDIGRLDPERENRQGELSQLHRSIDLPLQLGLHLPAISIHVDQMGERPNHPCYEDNDYDDNDGWLAHGSLLNVSGEDVGAEFQRQVRSRLRRSRRGLVFFGVDQTEFLQLVAQRVAADIEQLGGMSLISICLVHGQVHQLALHFLQRSASLGNLQLGQAAAVGQRLANCAAVVVPDESSNAVRAECCWATANGR